jgi:hypothetical protein
MLGALSVADRPCQALHELRGGMVGAQVYGVNVLIEQHCGVVVQIW